MRGSFTRAADKPIEQEALRAANQILSSTLFLSVDNQPMSYGNHTFAEPAARAFSKTEAAELALSPQPVTSLAGQVIMEYQKAVEGRGADYTNMYAMWKALNKQGVAGYTPHKLPTRAIA